MPIKLRIATFNLENLDNKPGEKATLDERIAVMRPQLIRLNALFVPVGEAILFRHHFEERSMRFHRVGAIA